MKGQKKEKVIREIYWLAAIGIAAALVEYVVIELLNLHPVISLRVQGFIGLVLIGYGIRMIARLFASEDDTINSSRNGQG